MSLHVDEHSAAQLNQIPRSSTSGHASCEEGVAALKPKSTHGGQIRDYSPEEEPCTPAVDAASQEMWNHPRINVWRTLVACHGFLIMGLNDAVYGVYSCLLSAVALN